MTEFENARITSAEAALLPPEETEYLQLATANDYWLCTRDLVNVAGGSTDAWRRLADRYGLEYGLTQRGYIYARQYRASDVRRMLRAERARLNRELRSIRAALRNVEDGLCSAEQLARTRAERMAAA